MSGFVYMMSDKPRGVIYTGVTSDLQGRIWEHRNDVRKGFTSRYNAKLLVWFEQHPNIVLSIRREKSLKRYVREWKIKLIEGLTRHGSISTTGFTRSTTSIHRIRILRNGRTITETAVDPRDKPEDDGIEQAPSGATGNDRRP